MAWKIHLENREPIGGDLPGAHVIPELPPLFSVETQEEAENAITALIGAGVKNIYAVGFDA